MFKFVKFMSFYFLSVAMCSCVSGGSASAASSLPNGSNISKNNREAIKGLATMSIIAESDPTQQVVLWTKDANDNPSTHWVRGNKHGTKIVGSCKGLFWPINKGVWKLIYDEIQVPLCKCQKYTDDPQQNKCSQSSEFGTMIIPKMVDIISGAQFELLPKPKVTKENDALYLEYNFESKVTLTMGPYVILRYLQNAISCDSSNKSTKHGFSVFNLETGQSEKVFTDAEAQKILENEQTIAFNELNSQATTYADEPSDLKFTSIEPLFFPGLAMTLRYQFTANTEVQNSYDNIWGSYSRSITIQAQTIPDVFIPFIPIQPALKKLAVFGENFVVSGFYPIAGTEQQYNTLLKIILGISKETEYQE